MVKGMERSWWCLLLLIVIRQRSHGGFETLGRELRGCEVVCVVGIKRLGIKEVGVEHSLASSLPDALRVRYFKLRNLSFLVT
jgi:hypothetical protein